MNVLIKGSLCDNLNFTVCLPKISLYFFSSNRYFEINLRIHNNITICQSVSTHILCHVAKFDLYRSLHVLEKQKKQQDKSPKLSGS